jgi:hypothetical protein
MPHLHLVDSGKDSVPVSGLGFDALDETDAAAFLLVSGSGAYGLGRQNNSSTLSRYQVSIM